MTLNIKEALAASIETLKTLDYKKPATVLSTRLYLDPEAASVVLYQDDIRGLTAENLGIDVLIATIPERAIPEDVYQAVKSVEPMLLAVLEVYHVSPNRSQSDQKQWRDFFATVFEEIETQIAIKNIRAYWNPGQWFDSDHTRIRILRSRGMTAEQIVDRVGIGDNNGQCQRPEAIEWMQKFVDGMAEEWEEKSAALIILVGLPCSGKSTWAKSKLDRAAIVCPDEIRKALHGQAFIKSAEPMVWATAKLMVAALFGAGHRNVILDACSHTEERRKEWFSDQWETRFKYIDTPKDVCIQRAVESGQEHLIPIIERMAGTIQIPIPEEIHARTTADLITWINSQRSGWSGDDLEEVLQDCLDNRTQSEF